jgi:hypothetical protein
MLRRSVLALTLVLAACAPTPVVVQPQGPVIDMQPQAEAPAAPTAVPAVAAEPTPPAVAVAPTPLPTVVPAVVAPPAVATAIPQVVPLLDPCNEAPRQSLPAPGAPGAQDFFRGFRDPLPATRQYNPSGPKRVGLQAGHWKNNEVPPELGRLQGGSSGGGKAEWEVNLDVARRVAALLEAEGVEVDVLPATVPPKYQAHVFVALHADGDVAGVQRGFKIARPGFSSLPAVDDRLVDVLNNAYGAITGLPRDDEHITLRMRYYYAFNARRYCHSVATGVPQAIVELGYMTSATDRQWLIGNPGKVAQGVAAGISDFLATLP